MIKLGSTTINKIRLGSTLINKVFLGANQVYPTGASPPSSILLEGFEEVPFTGLYSDWSDQTGTSTTSRTTSHVTQSSFTWRCQATTGNTYQIATGVFDITPYIASPTQFQIDIFVQTINPADIVALSVSDSVNDEFAQSSLGQSGAFTLTVPIGTLTDFTNIQFVISGLNGSFIPLVGAIDFYVDNLRAS